MICSGADIPQTKPLSLQSSLGSRWVIMLVMSSKFQFPHLGNHSNLLAIVFNHSLTDKNVQTEDVQGEEMA